MSWITVFWSMAAMACLTLAAIQFAIWLKRRREVARQFFARSALGSARSGFIVAAPAPIKSKTPLSNLPEELVLLPENAFESKLADRVRWR